MGGFLLSRLPETDDELYYAVQALWGVVIPRHKVCEQHVSPFQAFRDAYFAENTIDPDSPVQSIALWHGSRGLSGKSFMLSVLGITEAFLLGTKVNLLGGSLNQSNTIHEHMREAMEHHNAPRWMVETESNTRIRLSNKAVIKPLTASQKTVRGPHPSRILLDEIDEMELEILDAALGQPMAQKAYNGEIIKPYTVMCSTWQNPDGTFTEIMKRAHDKRIPTYAWCYEDTANPIDGWLTQEAIAEKKASIPQEMWRVEYELGEPSIGNRAFVTEFVDKTFTLDVAPISEKVYRDFEELVFEEPIRDAKYVAAADWAKESDYTVIMVARVDKHPREVVYYLKVNRQPYPVMIRYFHEAIKKYHAMAIHDATGLGNVINDLMEDMGIPARKFIMSGTKRADMLTEFVSSIEKDSWRAPKRLMHSPGGLKSAYSEMKFCRVGDLYSSAMEYHLPDSVCAWALMEHQSKRLWGTGHPVVAKRDPEHLNKYQRTFEPPRPEEGTVSHDGDVHMVTPSEDQFYNLIV